MIAALRVARGLIDVNDFCRPVVVAGGMGHIQGPPMTTPRLRRSAPLQAVTLCLLATAFLGHATGAARIRPEASANQFWESFRQAVTERDSAQLDRLAHFPFVVRWGNADPNDPRVTVDRQHFSKAVDHLLGLRIGSEPKDGRTMADVVNGTTEIPPTEAASGEFIVESFEFRRIAGTWKWTAAFTDDPYFFPQSDSDQISRTSLERKSVLDAISGALALKRPLKVLHIRRAANAAYVEAQEPGSTGRIARALLTKQPNDSKGRMVWAVTEHSFRQGANDVEWRGKVAEMIKAGKPASLFPTTLTTEERRPDAQ